MRLTYWAVFKKTDVERDDPEALFATEDRAKEWQRAKMFQDGEVAQVRFGLEIKLLAA